MERKTERYMEVRDRLTSGVEGRDESGRGYKRAVGAFPSGTGMFV